MVFQETIALVAGSSGPIETGLSRRPAGRLNATIEKLFRIAGIREPPYPSERPGIAVAGYRRKRRHLWPGADIDQFTRLGGRGLHGLRLEGLVLGRQVHAREVRGGQRAAGLLAVARRPYALTGRFPGPSPGQCPGLSNISRPGPDACIWLLAGADHARSCLYSTGKSSCLARTRSSGLHALGELALCGKASAHGHSRARGQLSISRNGKHSRYRDHQGIEHD